MANTLPIIGTNNLGLTSKLPRWNHQLRFEAGSLVTFDIDPATDAVNYQLFINPIEDKAPALDDTNNPMVDPDWLMVTLT